MQHGIPLSLLLPYWSDRSLRGAAEPLAKLDTNLEQITRNRLSWPDDRSPQMRCLDLRGMAETQKLLFKFG